MTKRTIISLLVMFSAFSFLPAQAAEPEHITSFEYRYRATIGGNSYFYQLRKEGDKAVFTLFEMREPFVGEITDTVAAEIFPALEEICTKHNVWKFAGFSGFDPLIDDGCGFALYIRFDNGKSISADGMNSYPDGYREFSRDMHQLFEPYCEQLRATKTNDSANKKTLKH